MLLRRTSLKHARQRFSMTSELYDDDYPIIESRMSSSPAGGGRETLPSPWPQPPTHAYIRPKRKADAGSFGGYYGGGGGDGEATKEQATVLPPPMRPVYTTSIPSPYYQDTEWRVRAARTEARRRRTHQNIIAAAVGGIVVMVSVLVVFVILGTQKVI